jgi:hypothetical protein
MDEYTDWKIESNTLKISGFPASFKTKDVKELFITEPYIRWENDTVAYAVFESAVQARAAYSAFYHPEATVEPVIERERPPTTDVVARRMIAGALGMKAKKKTNEEIAQEIAKVKQVNNKSKKPKDYI